MPNHILRNDHWHVIFSIMDEESNADGILLVFLAELTNKVKPTHPTKFGRIVHDLACVFIGMLFCNASRRFGKATKKGPRQIQAHRKNIMLST
jgi:hypothetical protein